MWSQTSIISALLWREQFTFWWDDVDDVRFALYQYDIYSASLLKQQFLGKHVALLENIF